MAYRIIGKALDIDSPISIIFMDSSILGAWYLRGKGKERVSAKEGTEGTDPHRNLYWCVVGVHGEREHVIQIVMERIDEGTKHVFEGMVHALFDVCTMGGMEM